MGEQCCPMLQMLPPNTVSNPSGFKQEVLRIIRNREKRMCQKEQELSKLSYLDLNPVSTISSSIKW